MCDGPKLEQHAEELSGCWCCWSVEGEKVTQDGVKEAEADHTSHLVYLLEE